MASNKDLDFWINNKYNVLFIGEAGVGKTSMVLDAFDRNDLKWQYYSASTMDPWVDLVGVPKEVQDDNGESVLDLIKPKQWQEDQIQAVFIDEFNRAAKKVRNAIMELIQFKSINGKEYNNLQIVWAAINPEDSDMDNEYDVEQLDPAQKDRFHFHVNIPYKPSLSYFQKKYGKDLANPAVEWWNNLPKEIKKEVSPRRLDYAVDIYSKGGKLDYALPKKSNISKLVQSLGLASYLSQLHTLEKSNDDNKLSEWLNDPNNYFNVKDYVWSTTNTRKRLVPLLSEERIATMFKSKPEYKKELVNINHPVIEKVINDISLLDLKKKKKDKKLLEDRVKPFGEWESFNPKGLSTRIGLSMTGTVVVDAQSLIKSNTTYDRRKAVGLVVNHCPSKDKLTPDVAKAMLDVLMQFSSKSQILTIKNQYVLISCANHLINYLLEENEFTLKMIPVKARIKLCKFNGFILKK